MSYIKAMEDSPEIGFQLVEQTEFIDDATFQAFKVLFNLSLN